jgi:hypothetical protein
MGRPSAMLFHWLYTFTRWHCLYLCRSPLCRGSFWMMTLHVEGTFWTMTLNVESGFWILTLHAEDGSWIMILQICLKWVVVAQGVNICSITIKALGGVRRVDLLWLKLPLNPLQSEQYNLWQRKCTDACGVAPIVTAVQVAARGEAPIVTAKQLTARVT